MLLCSILPTSSVLFIAESQEGARKMILKELLLALNYMEV